MSKADHENGVTGKVTAEMTGKATETAGKGADMTGADKATGSAPALVDETSSGDIDLGRREIYM
jgi:hypothetical protein